VPFDQGTPVVTTPGRRFGGKLNLEHAEPVGGGELVFLIPVEECACGPVFPHRVIGTKWPVHGKVVVSER
jgi:hypothetical protein